MSSTHPKQDPAVVAMTLDILGNVLGRADNPGALGSYLTEEIRELTGARCVVFIQCLDAESGKRHRVLSVNPERRRGWAESPEAHRLYSNAHRINQARIWRAENTAEAAGLNLPEEFGLSLAVPLNVGTFRVGAMLALGLPDDRHLESELHLLNTLSTVVALVLRNAFLYEQQEQIIQERTQRLQLATASGQLGVWDWDIVNDVLVWDDRMYELYGIERGTCRPCFEFWLNTLHPDDRAQALEESRAALRGEKEYDTEFRIVRSDGTMRTIKANALTTRDAEGKAIHQIGINCDISEQKTAQLALIQSELKYRELVENANSIIVQWTPDGVITFMNEFGLKFFGYTEAELIGRLVAGTLVPETESTGRNLSRLMEEICAAPRKFERNTNQNVRRNGERVWIDWTNKVMADERGIIKGIFSVGTDITERKRAEDAIREASQFNQQIINGAKDGIIVYDRELKYQVWNTFMEHYTGVAAGEVLGRNILEAFPFHRETGLLQNLDKALAGEATQPIEFPFYLKESGHSGWCSDSVAPLRNTAGEIIGVIGIVRDITGWKQAEEERLRLEEHVVQNQKMDAIGQLAGGIAHDFNNMLTGILGYANLLKMDVPPGSATFDAADTIEKSAERAAELTRKLLGFARRGKFLTTAVDVNELVREVVSLLSRTINKNIGITQRLAADDAIILGDPNQIQQVILNLAINARDAMPEGGDLTLETRVETLDEEFCRLHPELKPGVHVAIAVTDTGCGISEGDRQRIFEPFFTTKEPGKGTGMGLAMVYGIVKNHGGAISVYSEVGNGSRFSVYFPYYAPDKARKAEPQEFKMLQGAGKILLVDDEDIIRKVASKMLRTLGHEVLEADGGQQALSLCQKHGPQIVLAIIDMIMPGMDGQATLHALRKIKPDLKAILSSGYTLDGRAQETMDQGMLEFIPKPYKLNQLAEAIKKACKPE